MAYVLKSTSPAQVTTDTEANTATVNQGFMVWVDGYPATLCGTTIQVVIANSSTKTQAQIEAEVLAEVNAYIAANYPNT